MRITSGREGYAIVGLLIVVVIILSATLAVQTAACITVNRTAAAFDTAKQNAVFLSRLERAAREAAQASFGQSLSRDPSAFSTRLEEILSAAPLGDVELAKPEFAAAPAMPLSFPDWRGAPSALSGPSKALWLSSGPRVRQYLGAAVAESDAWVIRFEFSRSEAERVLKYDAEVECRFAFVPLTRFPVCLYDLPEEIGEGSDHPTWPARISPDALAPRGLVSSRDPAAIADTSANETRSAEFRNAAALAEAYQYLFSSKYLQSLADYAGTTHFVQIGSAAANPTLIGGTEAGKVYSLDVGSFGEGRYATRTVVKNAAVIVGATNGCSVVLNDTDPGSGAAGPVLIALVGPARDTEDPLRVVISSALRRPIVLICYHCRLEGVGVPSVNGAVFCDPVCSVDSTTERIVVGHLSCSGSAATIADHFEISNMPAAAALLAPRVVHVVTSSRFL
ncbi:MAG TPA: hypothetical protein VFT72_19405 [Opitutaceae bacterium]|nr:hypothetical protein [Opitutaceae bacterium]